MQLVTGVGPSTRPKQICGFVCEDPRRRNWRRECWDDEEAADVTKMYDLRQKYYLSSYFPDLWFPLYIYVYIGFLFFIRYERKK
jgi:hypothetical protein